MIGIASLLLAKASLAGGVVADCAPATVVAAATGARGALLARARTFHDLAPDYQQDRCLSLDTGSVMPRDGACEAPSWWRTDCSGFVSGVWALSSSLDTSEFGHGGERASHVWVEKTWETLEPGDAVNLPGDHIALFTGWLDAARSRFCVMEEIHAAYTDPWDGLGCIADSRSTAVSRAQGFVPIGLTGLDAASADAGDGGGEEDAGARASEGDATALYAMTSRLSWLTIPLGAVVVAGRRRRGSPRRLSRSPLAVPSPSHPEVHEPCERRC
jgi:hypothetical protein